MLGCLTLESKLRPNKAFKLGYGCRSVAGRLSDTQGLGSNSQYYEWGKSYKGVNGTTVTSASGRVPQLHGEYKEDLPELHEPISKEIKTKQEKEKP